MNSSRLPGKVLLPFGNKTNIERVVERVRRSKYAGNVVVATSAEKSDDLLADLCARRGIKFYRGSLDDVLDRYYQSANKLKLKHICRVTADCPLIDPKVIDLVALKYMEGGYDCVGVNRPLDNLSYPDGLDVEIFTFEALKKAWQEAKLLAEREHVMPYIWNNPDKFRLLGLRNKVDWSAYRLALDEADDYKLLSLIYSKVKPLTTENIIKFLDKNPKIRALNSRFTPNQGYTKSVEEQSKIKSHNDKKS